MVAVERCALTTRLRHDRTSSTGGRLGQWAAHYLSTPRVALTAASLVSSVQWSVVTGLLTTTFGMATSVIIARSLGPARMGEYSYWTWLLGVLPVVVNLGIPGAALKFSAELLGKGEEDEAGALVLGLIKVQVAVAGAVAALLVLYGVVAEGGSRWLLYMIVAGVVLVGGVVPVVDSAIKGAIDYRFSAHIAIALGIVQLALVVLVVDMDWGVNGLLLVLLVSATASLVVRLPRMQHLYPWARRTNVPAEIKSAVFRYCRVLAGMSLLDVIVMSRSEVFFLNLYWPGDQIAFYSLAYGIAGALIMGATLITHPLLPAFSMLSGRGDWLTISRVYRAAVKCVAFVIFPTAVAGIVLARPLIVLLYSDAYAPTAPVLAIVAASGITAGLGFVFSALLYGVGKPDILIRLFAVLAPVNVLAALVLIPPYGAIGAALANGVGPLIQFVVLVELLRRKFGLPFPFVPAGKILIAAALAAVLGDQVRSLLGVAWLVPAGVLGVSGYLASVVVLRAFDSEDRAILSAMGDRLPTRMRAWYASGLDGVIPRNGSLPRTKCQQQSGP